MPYKQPADDQLDKANNTRLAMKTYVIKRLTHLAHQGRKQGFDILFGVLQASLSLERASAPLSRRWFFGCRPSVPSVFSPPSSGNFGGQKIHGLNGGGSFIEESIF